MVNEDSEQQALTDCYSTADHPVEVYTSEEHILKTGVVQASLTEIISLELNILQGGIRQVGITKIDRCNVIGCLIIVSVEEDSREVTALTISCSEQGDEVGVKIAGVAGLIVIIDDGDAD